MATTKYIKLFENFDQAEMGQLRALGLEPIRWEVELEIDFNQSSQNTPDYIKRVMVDWLPQVNAMSPEFQIVGDSIDIDEWEEEDYLTRNEELPTEDEIASMRKSDLLSTIEDFGLDVDADDARTAKLSELRELVMQAIEDGEFTEMNYNQRNFLRFELLTQSDDEQVVMNWLEDSLTGRVFSDVENLTKID